ncbi:MAG: helicase C-terminal domain-containing protein [Clostridium sp.]
MVKSILDNVVFFDIETTGNDPYQNEIYEISALKFKEGKLETYHAFIRTQQTKWLNNVNKDLLEQIKNGIEFKYAKEDFQKFIEDLPLISHNPSLKHIFLLNHIRTLRNSILNTMELAAILEPFRSDISLYGLIKEITDLKVEENNRASLNALNTVKLTNALLLRHFQREESLRKNTLYDILVKYYNLKYDWGFTKYLLKPIFLNGEDYPYVIYGEKPRELPKLSPIKIDYSKYEELLKECNIWNNGGDFGYEYRSDQEAFSNKIRENYEKGERIFIEAPTGSGKTFAYVLVAAIGTYISKENKRWEDASFVISTDTKELQNQLIDRDIPNILHKLKLLDKVSYGAMKGKNNYLCVERLRSADCFEGIEGRLTRIFLGRLGQSGEYGEISTINFWAYKHFNIENYWNEVCCDSEKCNLDRCAKPCFLRKRYNEIPGENITVINHSLLASWPYGEKKKIIHLILDESHNLMEKAYDFFTEEFNSKEFIELISSIENGRPSIYMLLNKLNGEHGYREQISLSALKQLVEELTTKIFTLLGGFREMGLQNESYNFITELYLPREEYKECVKSIFPPLSGLKESIYNLYRLLKTYVENIMLDDETNGDNDYKSIMEFILKIKEGFDVIDKILSPSTFEAKILEVDMEYREFTLRNTPLKVGELINDNLLKGVKSTTFLSATLRVDNSFRMIKNHLGQNTAKEYRVPQIFDLKRRTKIFGLKTDEKYNSKNYVEYNAKFIYEIGKKLGGHILVLFNNNKRREEFYEKLLELARGSNIEIHRDKKSISLLRDENKNVIILGSKGFFEGIDVPGDGLSCVIIDKIPNKTPEDPILKAITNYENKKYYEVNYPQLCIKMKQIYGRLIRSKLDYGYFIILDPGENDFTLNNIQRDLGGPPIIRANRDGILRMIDGDFQRWKKSNFDYVLNESRNTMQDFNEVNKKYKLFWKANEEGFVWKRNKN